jgi:hypothetical protein
MAAEVKGGEQRPRCEEEGKSGRRLFEAVDNSAYEASSFRKALLLTPLSSWRACAW